MIKAWDFKWNFENMRNRAWEIKQGFRNLNAGYWKSISCNSKAE